MSQYKKVDLKVVGQRIRGLRGSQSQLVFARKLNVHQVDISRLERGETVNPSPELLLNICRLQDPPIHMEWLISGEGRKTKGRVQEDPEAYQAGSEEAEFVYLSQLYQASGVGLRESLDHRAVVDHLAFKKKWVQDTLQVPEEKLLLIEAMGDSMEPTLYHGDLLLIDASRDQMRDDGIYCFRTPNEEVWIKRLQSIPGEGLAVKSDNPKYEAFTLSEAEKKRYAIIGPVVWIGRKF
ncbi:XRE family transcriptional regulator [Nitrospina watsonii]|uniref:XRE family transcriptional regulator n=1 Tax=Nitrospina watsonii TaxID=1323948 RepID=UPI00248F602C|nr:helix-turn-helix transcriptional regulator [Nitrospina watsonii]